MNVEYMHTPYNCKSSTASGMIVSKKGPLFPQKHYPAKFSGYRLAGVQQIAYIILESSLVLVYVAAVAIYSTDKVGTAYYKVLNRQ